jgi:acetyl esterase/lipase
LAVIVLPAANAAEPAAAPATYEYRVVRDLPYVDGDKADPVKHRLDLILPRGKKDFPVLFFIHGGAWQTGDKDYFGIYSAFAMLLAKNGIGAVVPSYRLSPAVKHPEHIKDVARAFAWTCQNLPRYGGRTDQLFVSGHSAGGHLAALLASDESYLKSEGLSLGAIKGVIPMSGVYYLPDGYFTDVFGTDHQMRANAWPISHVKETCPPMLILYAEKDFPTCDLMAQALGKALKEKNVPAEVQEIKKRNHISIMVNACLQDDPAAQAVLRFVDRHRGQ